MRKRFFLSMVAAGIFITCGVAVAGPAIGIMASIHNCQNAGLAPESRIEACSQAIHTNLLSHGILAAVYYNRGVAYETAHDIDHARQDYDKALELKPDFVQAQASRARISAQNQATTVRPPAEVH